MTAISPVTSSSVANSAPMKRCGRAPLVTRYTDKTAITTRMIS